MPKKKVSTECVETSSDKVKIAKVTTSEPIKKKRGRPRKVVEAVTSPKETSTECSVGTSSPVGTSTECSGGEIVKKKRGRPAKKKSYAESAPMDLSKVKTLKLLGFCTSTECTGALTDADFEEGKKTIVVCIRCGTRQKLSELLESSDLSQPRNVSKRAFLNDVTTAHAHVEASHEANAIKVPNELQVHVEDSDFDS